MIKTPLLAFSLAAALLLTAFTLACRLTASATLDMEPSGDSVMDRLLGGSRALVGGICIERADLYLHRGLGEEEDPPAFTNRWFQRLGDAVSPTVVEHREGAALREVLPWVTLASRFAPTNSEYVLTQVYLMRVIGERDRALAMLTQARSVNPQDPELPMEEARIRISIGQWDRAASILDTCARLIGSQPATDDLRRLLAETCALRGLLYEHNAQTNAAVTFLTGAAKLEPRLYGSLNLRIADLANGRTPQQSATAALTLRTRNSEEAPCAHHGHEGHYTNSTHSP